jgi:calcium-dependent protein kinase
MSSKQFFQRVQEYSAMRREPFKQKRHIDKSLQSLLQGLLEKDAKKRFSAAQAVEHSWFQEGMRSTIQLRESMWSSAASANASTLSTLEMATVSEKSLEGTPNSCPTPTNANSIVKRAMNYRQATQFEKAILSIIAYQEASSEIDTLREQFIALDTHGNGTLSRDELASGIKEAGITMSNAEVNKVFDSLDADRTGKVHFCEFLSGTLSPAEVTTDKAINDVFNFFDLDRTGRINRYELAEVLGSEAEASSLLSKAKTPGGKQDYLSKEDFGRVMKDIASNMEARYKKLDK